MSTWSKFFSATGLDSPNKSSQGPENFSSADRTYLSDSVFPSRHSTFLGTGPEIHCQIQETEITSDERLRQLNYNLAMLLLLKNNGHYYSPSTETSEREYLRSQFVDSIRDAVNAVDFSLNLGRNSLSGDMLSEVARALASIPHAENPVYATNLIDKLLRNHDPMVVDSMAVALSDYHPSWIESLNSLSSAIEEIPWPDVREDAMLAVRDMGG